MEEVIITKNDEVVMKLLHYFITEKGYNPVILHGAKDEIWLENLNEDYKIIRIVSSYIHNDEQLNLDLYRTKQIIRKIKYKTFSFKMNVLSLFVNLGDSVNLNNISYKSIDCANINTMKDVNKYSFIIDNYPDIIKETKSPLKGFNLFMKITNEINQKNQKIQKEAEEVFTHKMPIITYILIAINFIAYIYSCFNPSFLNSTYLNPSKVINGEYYRLITCAFVHMNALHLIVNLYAIYMVGSQIESFYGKIKYIIIYILSIVFASLLSVILTSENSLGASGAIFGLFGAMIYFGYHYRVYLGQAMRSQMIPVIVFNLVLGFMLPQVDNWAHIGGLIGGILVSSALGVKYKSKTHNIVNGIILSIIFLSFLIYLAFIK